ncbi:hypothetical protein [Vibrio sp. HN007]|uniref:hypothetical protein n=1 Tax=Vibrio iocasae TaxID=3098914 RepID=UPI0035D4E88D
MLETILVFLALVIAAMTLFIQRQHNRKQMLPLVHLFYQQHRGEEDRKVELKLINDGQGPAVFQGVSIISDEVETPIGNYLELERYIKKNSPKATAITTNLPFCIQANSSISLYSYTTSLTKDPIEDSLVKIISSSLYGDTVITTNSGLDVKSNSNDAYIEVVIEKLLHLITKIIKKFKKTA